MYGDYDEEMSSNYFVNHFRGNHSLALSYWINGGLISNVISLMMIGFVESLQRSGMGLQSSAILGIVLLVCSMAVWFWGVVGIWRSAKRYLAKGGASLWGGLAQVMVAISAIVMLGNLVGTSRSILDHSQLAIGKDSLGESADIRADGPNLFLDGPITLGVTDKVKAALDVNPNISVIHLKSGGGRVREGSLLAQHIKARGLTTTASGVCASSCTIAFLAGSERLLGENGKLGFHSPSGLDISDAEARQGDVDMRSAYQAASLPQAFITRALATPSETMWYPSLEELINAGVITGLTKEWIIRENIGTAKANNQQGPQKLDDVTTLVSTQAEGLAVTYVYKVQGYASNFSRNAVKAEMERNNRKVICQKPGAKMMINSGAVINYDYKDLSGELIARATVGDC